MQATNFARVDQFAKIKSQNTIVARMQSQRVNFLACSQRQQNNGVHVFLQNYQLKKQQVSHYKELVEEARKLQNGIDSVEKVERDEIESVLKETLDLQQRGLSDVKG